MRRALGKGTGASEWQFDTAAVVEWLRTETQRNVAPGVDISEARRRRAVAMAELAELEAATAKGKLVEVEVVQLAWAKVLVNVKQHLLRLPIRCAPRLVGVTDAGVIHARLTSELHEVLEELASEENARVVIDDVEGALAAVHEGNGEGLGAPQNSDES